MSGRELDTADPPLIAPPSVHLGSRNLKAGMTFCLQEHVASTVSQDQLISAQFLIVYTGRQHNNSWMVDHTVILLINDTNKQTRWRVDGVMYSFYSMSVNEAAVLNSEL